MNNNNGSNKNNKNEDKKFVLLVDDEINVLRSIKRVLEGEGYEILLATSGKEGLEILKNHPIQVVISDQRMPFMNGSQFLTQVNNLYPHTIRMLLSAYSDFEATKEAINSGAIYKFLSKPCDVEILKMHINDALKVSSEQLAKEKQLTQLMNYDKLTGLYNRKSFKQIVTETINTDQNSTFAIISVDIKRLHAINKDEGELAGDLILQQMAYRLNEWMKNDGIVSRFEGGEFLLLVKKVVIAQLELKLVNLESFLKEPFFVLGKKLFISVNMGVSVFPKDAKDCEKLINYAIYARFHAKELAEKSFYINTNELQHELEYNFISESTLNTALQENQFFIVYQPIISVSNNQIVGAEALIRWHHPKIGLVGPDRFIPLCEESGIIIPLGKWIIETTLEQLKKWHENQQYIFISINLAAKQLHDENLFEFIKEKIKSNPIFSHHIKLEITESSLMKQIGKKIIFLSELKELGAQVSLDDFGTGYSSLNYLKELPIDILKIDKTFINELGNNKNSDQIVATIIQLAKNLNLLTVAEGVEKKPQLDFLKSKQCDLYQGYLYSKPLALEDFNHLLMTSLIVDHH